MTDTAAPERDTSKRGKLFVLNECLKAYRGFPHHQRALRAIIADYEGESDLMERRIAEAVEAERERCADYALMWVGHWEDEEGDAASVIAAAIRTQTEGQNNLTPDSKGQGT